MKRRVPTRHLLAGYSALYGPSTDRKKAEAERLAAEHCARVESGVPHYLACADSAQPGPIQGATGTSRRCPKCETTPAGGAWCTGDAGAHGRGGLPPGDSPTHFDAA